MIFVLFRFPGRSDGDADSGVGQDSHPVSPSHTEDEGTTHSQATSQTTSPITEG